MALEVFAFNYLPASGDPLTLQRLLEYADLNLLRQCTKLNVDGPRAAPAANSPVDRAGMWAAGAAVGVVLGLIILPSALGFSWYLGAVTGLPAAPALTLLLMAKAAGKL